MQDAGLTSPRPTPAKIELRPNGDQMLRHLSHLFGGPLDGYHDGLIELAWTDKQTGALNHAELFATDKTEELVEAALTLNAVEGQNVYIGQALRKPETPPFGRSSDDDFYALTTNYCDLDAEGAVAAARENYRSCGCPPTGVVVTGTKPHTRAQLHWRLDEPETNPEKCRQQNSALCAALSGDPSVVNPGRVMRLGGSIAWPVKKGRVVEATVFRTFDDNRPRTYVPGQLARAFPPQPIAPQATAAPVLVGGLDLRGEDDTALIEKIKGGEKWHDNVLALTGRWVTLGLSDDEILARAGELTLAGFTVEQTARELRVMIGGARKKGFDDGVKLVQPPAAATDVFRSWQPTDAADIPPRDFLYGRHYIRKFVSGTVAQGGVGKSTLALFEGIAIAARLAEHGCKDSDLVVAYYNAEDPLDEIKRRVVAICQHARVNQRDLVDRLFIASGRDANLLLAQGEAGVINEKVFEFLGGMIEQTGADILVLDPLANMTTSPETNEVFRLLGARLSALADEQNISIEIVHHTRKLQSGGEANHEDARGGGALVNGMRSVRVLNNMTASEARTAGLETHVDHFRIEDGKANLARRSERAAWWRKVSVELDNGDHVAALEPWQWPDFSDHFKSVDIGRALDLMALERDAMRLREYHTSEGWAGEIICNVKGDALQDLDAKEAAAWREAAGTKDAKARSPMANQYHAATKTLLADLKNNGFLEIINAADRRGNDRKCYQRTEKYYEIAGRGE